MRTSHSALQNPGLPQQGDQGRGLHTLHGLHQALQVVHLRRGCIGALCQALQGGGVLQALLLQLRITCTHGCKPEPDHLNRGSDAVCGLHGHAVQQEQITGMPARMGTEDA